jgi:predicted transcriptional regulator
MTKLLEKGIEAVKALPADQQDAAGALLLEIAQMGLGEYSLTPAQIEDLEISIAQADRGEFATDEEMAETWAKFGK